MNHPWTFAVLAWKKEFFLGPQTTLRVGRRLLRVGCQFHVAVSFTCTHHLEKFVETGKLYIFFVVSFSKSRKKKKTMNINSKRKKNPGKEIEDLLFFIVGKVAILSTFFDWRKSNMHLTLVYFFYYILFRTVLGHSDYSGQLWCTREWTERENERNSLENETMGSTASTLDVLLHT